MKFTTLCAVRFNDGREVPQDQMNRLIDELVLQFSGCSGQGVTKGQWLDPKDSQLYRDESRRTTVVCDNRLLGESAAGRRQGVGPARYVFRKFAITMVFSFSKSLPNETRVHAKVRSMPWTMPKLKKPCLWREK